MIKIQKCLLIGAKLVSINIKCVRPFGGSLLIHALVGLHLCQKFILLRTKVREIKELELVVFLRTHSLRDKAIKVITSLGNPKLISFTLKQFLQLKFFII